MLDPLPQPARNDGRPGLWSVITSRAVWPILGFTLAYMAVAPLPSRHGYSVSQIGT
jgi:hypothetical protein